MSDRQLDALFVHSGSRPIYQALSDKFSAREPPTWALLLAQSCRAAGYGVAILDQDAEGLTDEQAVEKVREANPRLTVFVVYGSEPNQSTTRMATAAPLCELLKKTHPQYKTCFVGGHVAALPLEVLALPGVDFVCLNEGVYSLRNLLDTDIGTALQVKGGSDADGVKGVGWKDHFGGFHTNPPERIVPQGRMDADLPGHAWDLIDLKKYRSHFWFSRYDHEKRSPYAALYTSLGCPFSCGFCCIQAPFHSGGPDKGNAFRYWSPLHSFREIDKLAELGVTNIRLSDEMFFLRRSHYEPLLEMIRDFHGDSLNLWAYARVDTVKPQDLELFRSAGVRWLCLGVESANTTVRREIAKGSYEEVDVRQVVREIEAAGIDVIMNVIFGLPGDSYATMRQTQELACELNCSMFNCYPCINLPGSPLYEDARSKGLPLPDSYAAHGFLSYECTPNATEHLTAAEVLRFRDEAFHHYWSRPSFLDSLCRKFGPDAVRNVESMLKVRLKRKLLGDPPPE